MNRLFRSGLISFILMICSPISASAEPGHCVYMLYSDYLGRSLKVCQTAAEVAECGTWPSTGTARWPMAIAEGKAENKLQYKAGDCPRKKAVGVCRLPTSNLFFYEGRIEDLTAGCGRMQGIFEVLGPD